MINYSILKIKLLSIIESIDDYTSEPIISVPCATLKNDLENDTMTIDVLEYCCNIIEDWYKDNLSHICSNQYVIRPENHKKNTQTIKEINEDIQVNREEYEKYFSNPSISQANPSISGDKIFIVHGHDNGLKNEVARFLEKLKLKPIILHEQASEGETIIEKIERYSNVGFGIVLYTPCDKGGLANDGALHLNSAPSLANPPCDKGGLANDGAELRCRARQNVVFEHGYLIGKLERKNVCALVKDDVEKPNDISGVVYVSYDESGAWKIEIAKELKAAGYNIDFNKLF